MLDEASRNLIYNAVKEDDILNLNVTSKFTLLGHTYSSHGLTRSTARYRTDRRTTAVQPADGCPLYPVRSPAHHRLCSGRLREEEVQKIILGVDVMSVNPYLRVASCAQFSHYFPVLDPGLRARFDRSQMVQEQLAGFQTISIDYFPRESRLVTFRDPWSFPVLFHPDCNHLIRQHLATLAHKVWHFPIPSGLCDY